MTNKKHQFTKEKRRSWRKHKYEESVIAVPCTRRLQRRMFRNLKNSAHSNINLDRSARAAELLAKIEVASKTTTADKVNKHITANMPVEMASPAKDAVRDRIHRVWQFVNTAFKNCAGGVSSFVRQKLLFRAAHGG